MADGSIQRGGSEQQEGKQDRVDHDGIVREGKGGVN